MKLKQLFCRHKRARIIDKRSVEHNIENSTAIAIITYKCPGCGRVFEREYTYALPDKRKIIVEIDGDKVAESINSMIK